MKILLNNWFLPLGWGIGQAFNWLIGSAIGSLILGGEIGGVIYTSKTADFIVVCIGGGIGGAICGGILSWILKRRVPGFGHFDGLILVMAWSVAFGLGEVLYRMAQLANFRQFSTIVVFFAGVLNNILIGIIGGSAISLLSQYKLRQALVSISFWSAGLVIGFSIGSLVSWSLWTSLGFSVTLEMKHIVSNATGGFFYGFIAALIGRQAMNQSPGARG